MNRKFLNITVGVLAIAAVGILGYTVVVFQQRFGEIRTQRDDLQSQVEATFTASDIDTCEDTSFADITNYPNFKFDYNTCDWFLARRNVDPEDETAGRTIVLLKDDKNFIRISIQNPGVVEDQVKCEDADLFKLDNAHRFLPAAMNDSTNKVHMYFADVVKDSEEGFAALAAQVENSNSADFCYTTPAFMTTSSDDGDLHISVEYYTNQNNAELINLADLVVQSMEF